MEVESRVWREPSMVGILCTLVEYCHATALWGPISVSLVQMPWNLHKNHGLEPYSTHQLKQGSRSHMDTMHDTLLVCMQSCDLNGVTHPTGSCWILLAHVQSCDHGLMPTNLIIDCKHWSRLEGVNFLYIFTTGKWCCDWDLAQTGKNLHEPRKVIISLICLSHVSWSNH